MSLISRVINARPTKESKYFCYMSVLSVTHVAFKGTYTVSKQSEVIPETKV